MRLIPVVAAFGREMIAKRTLIIGAYGFIGRAVALRILAEGV